MGPSHEGPVSPYASPSVAEDLSGLPSAFVSVMEFDPLRDEGLIYAMRLLEAGVSTEIHAYPGTFHGSSLISNARSASTAPATHQLRCTKPSALGD